MIQYTYTRDDLVVGSRWKYYGPGEPASRDTVAVILTTQKRPLGNVFVSFNLLENNKIVSENCCYGAESFLVYYKPENEILINEIQSAFDAMKKEF